MDATTKVFRQGELLFVPVKFSETQRTSMTNEMLTPKSTNCIREGEASGHKHEIIGNAVLSDVTRERSYIDRTYIDIRGEMFLDATDPVEVIHPEHETLKLSKGQYVIRIQKEYDEVKDRLVAD